MRIIHPFLLFITVSLPILLASCRDDDVKCYEVTNPDCENYDPCHNHKPADASFDIFEVVGDWRTNDYVLSETDTIMQFNGALFRQSSANKNQKLTWIVGAEKLQDLEEVYRYGFPVGWIEITLIAEMNSHECLKSTELHDTVTRRFYAIKRPEGVLDSNTRKNMVWWGTWEGYNTDDPKDTFHVTFGWINQSGWSDLSPAGLPEGLIQRRFYSHLNSVCSELSFYYGYRLYIFRKLDKHHQDFDAFGLNGICRREGSRIEIEYQYNNTPYQDWLNGEPTQDGSPIQWVKKKFVGLKASSEVITQ